MLRCVFKWTTLKVQSSVDSEWLVCFFQLQLVEELYKNYMNYLSVSCLVKQELEIQTCSFAIWLFQGMCRKGMEYQVQFFMASLWNQENFLFQLSFN